MSNVIPSKDVHKIHAWNKPEIKQKQNASHHGLIARQLKGIQKQAYEEGSAQGYQDGLTKGTLEIQNKVQYLESIIASLAQPLASLDDDIEDDLVRLVIAVTQQLVRREIKTDPGQVVAAVREAMSILPMSAQKIQIHLHPDDLDLVQEGLRVDVAEQSCRFVADPTQARGGCRISSKNSRVDASIDTRLKAVIASVFGGDRVSDET